MLWLWVGCLHTCVTRNDFGRFPKVQRWWHTCGDFYHELGHAKVGGGGGGGGAKMKVICLEMFPKCDFFFWVGTIFPLTNV